MKEYISRNDCRKMGLDYSSEQFRRWEKPAYNKKTGAKIRDALLTPFSFGPGARVYYRREEVEALIGARKTLHQEAA